MPLMTLWKSTMGVQSPSTHATLVMKGYTKGPFVFSSLEITKINNHHKNLPLMKELGSCPRCNGTEINTLNLYYEREEVCNNCGYVDIYKKHGAQNVLTNFIAYVILGLVVLGGLIAFLVMS